MIKLSKLSDYAIVVLSRLATEQGELQTASSLSEGTGIPEPTVAKVLKLLSRSGIIQSIRGVKGGYLFNRSPSEITITELIEALEGPVAITSCADEELENNCAMSGLCPIHGRWVPVNKAIKSALDQVFLADLLIPKRPSTRRAGL